MQSKIIHGDSKEVLKTLEAESVDALICDPPYALGFMGKAWDKALPDIEIFRECFRVMKPGAFAFVMSAPRSDVCARMMLLLEDAGFEIGFTPIYWTYASGFPKAMNIGKVVDKKLDDTAEIIKRWKDDEDYYWSETYATLKEYGWQKYLDDNGFVGSWGDFLPDYQKYKTFVFAREEQRIIGLDDNWKNNNYGGGNAKCGKCGKWLISGSPCVCPKEQRKPKTDEAKALDGSYGGFQPKPAVEVIIVAMKPLSEKTYVDQALKNGKGITWLDDARIPVDLANEGNNAKRAGKEENYSGSSGSEMFGASKGDFKQVYSAYTEGRFPANLICSDDVLNDGRTSKSMKRSAKYNKPTEHTNTYTPVASDYRDDNTYGDEGSYSRYFSLDSWWEKKLKDLPESVQKTFPFLIVPKAAKSEKNAGLDGFERKQSLGGGGITSPENQDGEVIVSGDKGTAGKYGSAKAAAQNHHPTVKPLTLMSYLITLASRPGDTVLDPFLGSGTTAVAAKMLGRECVGIEREEEYIKIAEARLAAVPSTLL